MVNDPVLEKCGILRMLGISRLLIEF